MFLKIVSYELHAYESELWQHFDNVQITNEKQQTENSDAVHFAKRIYERISREKKTTVVLRRTMDGVLRHEFHKFPAVKPKPKQIKKVELEDHVYRAVYNTLKSYHARKKNTKDFFVFFSEYGMEYISSPIHVALLCLKGILRSLFELNQVSESSQYCLNMVDKDRVKDVQHLLLLCADRRGLTVNNRKQAVQLQSLEDIRLLHDELHESGLSKKRLLRGKRYPPVVNPPSTFDHFPLHDLPKVCFLAVAERLENRGRRRLSHTCQRFRQLLIPENRYSDPPEEYWDESTLHEDLKMCLKRRIVPQQLEIRRPLRSVYIREYSQTEFRISMFELKDVTEKSDSTEDRGDTEDTNDRDNTETGIDISENNHDIEESDDSEASDDAEDINDSEDNDDEADDSDDTEDDDDSEVDDDVEESDGTEEVERTIEVGSTKNSRNRAASNLDDVWSFANPRTNGIFDAEHDYTIIGDWPTILQRTIHEINKYFVYGEIFLMVKSVESEQLYRMLTARHDCGKANVGLVFQNRQLSEASLRTLLTHFRDDMPASCRLFFCPSDQLQTLNMLKSIWEERGIVVKWRACPTAEREEAEVIEVYKTTIENTVFVEYDDDIQFQADN